MAEIKKEPFHKAIVDFINQAKRLTTLQDAVLLLSITKVPQNHEAIIKALRCKSGELCPNDKLILELERSLEEEAKEEAEKRRFKEELEQEEKKRKDQEVSLDA